MLALRPPSFLRRFLALESAGGLLLIAAAALAMIAANSPAYGLYHDLFTVQLGPLDLHHWINDGLMALFFFGVGLEIKREVVEGHLAERSDRALPIVAAVGGMTLPALVYLIVTWDMPALSRGWAIPAATDIAFALGVLALLGKRAPASLRLFLTTLAIVDDMGAVAIIALAYTAEVGWLALACAAAILGAMMLLSRRGVLALWPYLLLAALLWVAVLQSGVHPTVAGVLAALTVPVRRPAGGGPSPLRRLEHALHPWTAYLVVPLFGFANAGVELGALGWGEVLAPLPLGVAAGLFVGKQAGVFLSLRAAIALGIGRRPVGACWMQLYGVSLLAGVGFTMSLFIGALAFTDPLLVDEVKIGVLGGSILSAVAGWAVLRFARPFDRTGCA